MPSRSDHYLSLGMLGMHGTVYANYAINDADLLLALGVRFDDRVTGKLSEFAKHGRIVHVDIDASEINKNKTAHIAVNSDVKSFLTALNPQVEPGDWREWHQQIDAWRASDPMTYDTRDDAILPQYVIDQFSKLTKGDFVMTTGVGQHQMWAAQWTKFTQPRTLGHLRRPGLDGLRPPRRDGGPGRPSRRPGHRHRRRRQLPDEHPGAGHRLLREPAGQGDPAEQPAPGHGRAVGRPVPRRQPRPHLPRPHRPPRGDRPGRAATCPRSPIPTSSTIAKGFGVKARQIRSKDGGRSRPSRR